MSFIPITYIWLCQTNQNNVFQKEIKDLTIEVCNLSIHFLFKILSCMRPYIYDVHTEGGGEWGGGILKFSTCLLINRSIIHFCRWEVGWGSKNCFCFFVNVIIVWQLILKVTSIKRNVFSFNLLRFNLTFYTHTIKIKFFSWEYLKELHQHSIHCVLRKNVKWSSQRCI